MSSHPSGRPLRQHHASERRDYRMAPRLHDPEYPYLTPRLNRPLQTEAIGFLDPRFYDEDDENEDKGRK